VLESPHSTFLDGVDELDPVDEHGLWTVAAQQIDTGWSAIVTQTCDLVRHPDKVPFLQLMPVVELDEVTWKAAHYGSRGDYFALPAIGAAGLVFPAIDSQLSFPVSKAVLGHAEIPRAAAPLDPAARVLLSSWLMRRVGRYAFPNALEGHVLSHLRTKIAKSIGKNSMGLREVGLPEANETEAPWSSWSCFTVRPRIPTRSSDTTPIRTPSWRRRFRGCGGSRQRVASPPRMAATFLTSASPS
jgi:hypothetical protein